MRNHFPGRRLGAAALLSLAPFAVLGAQTGWPSFGHDPGGMRYSPLKQINTGNVTRLKLAWEYDTYVPEADAPAQAAASGKKTPPQTSPGASGVKSLATASAADSKLLPPGAGKAVVERMCTQCHGLENVVRSRRTRDGWASVVNEMVSRGASGSNSDIETVIEYLYTNFGAAESGKQKGNGNLARRHHRRYHRMSESIPLVIHGVLYMSTAYSRVVALDAETGKTIWIYKSPHPPALRGVSYWPGTKTLPPQIVFGTGDGWLISLNAKTGKPVPGFGDEGMVNLRRGVADRFPRLRLGMSSPPSFYKNLLITGSTLGERPERGPSGDVRAWDMRTGKLVWTFHTIPRPGEANHDTWHGNEWVHRSGADAWGFITVDVNRGIVYVPIGTANVDFWGGDRQGLDLYGASLVALDAATGKLKWYFQTSHHDNWDYDLCAAPILMTVKHKGKRIPAVAQITKSGYVFIFNRVTGKPIYGVKDVHVPNTNPTTDDRNWPTEPVPVKPPPLARTSFRPDEIAKVTPEHEKYCKDLLAREGGALTGGPFLHYGPKLAVIFPSWTGGTNWGGGAFDPRLGYLFVDTKNLANFNKLVPRSDGKGYARVGPDHPPVNMGDYFWDGTKKWPCQKPPWAQLIAVNVNTGAIAWRVPLGSFEELDKLGVPKTGTPTTNGGGIATAGNLIFIGATLDGKFRAFDSRTGQELWVENLGIDVNSIPITWLGKNGKQYVAVFASGASHGKARSGRLFVYALPRKTK